ncbi:helix-turn-helix transcriptional regulator [Aquirufa ecclesiirivi]|uniref:helix-turn-helix domain-containing protein n=1 Tax=Aquirufa ecclesiirivi TaxID=2715124 RepID=UPI0022A8B8FE|nr:AraC family transcriptional regulator [Aquirufa ecclesiirivi]MCZ2473136.1 helix-turn-helix transcriptional regulator [Aquirufa ecclesiirivi]
MIKTIAPISPILSKYIECFYIYEGKFNSVFSYVAFPHFNTGLSFFKGASVHRQNWSLQISENTDVGVHIEILGKYVKPVFLEYKGQLKEISIVFKPVGLNRFFKDNYLSLAPKFSQELKNDIWCKFGENLFSSDDDISKIESFLLSQFCDNQEVSSIENSLKLLENSNEQISISDIANKAGLNLKTFQRQFQKHMGCSPVEYRRIYRFRSTLTNKLNSTQIKNLTEITYEEGYYDQSYLIKEFRKITNHNPKDFFKSTSKVDGDKIIWEIK